MLRIENMVQETRTGRLHAVLSSPNHGYPTYPQQSVQVRLDGIVGDAHSGPLRDSFTNPGTQKPNDRPISMVALEVIEAMRDKFGIERTMKPGGFNEQLVSNGLGDLSDSEKGDVIRFEGGVTLEVVEGAKPCDRLNAYHGEPSLARSLIDKLPGGEFKTRRGLLAKVLIPGVLKPGEKVTISRGQITDSV